MAEVQFPEDLEGEEQVEILFDEEDNLVLNAKELPLLFPRHRKARESMDDFVRLIFGHNEERVVGEITRRMWLRAPCLPCRFYGTPDW